MCRAVRYTAALVVRLLFGSPDAQLSGVISRVPGASSLHAAQQRVANAVDGMYALITDVPLQLLLPRLLFALAATLLILAAAGGVAALAARAAWGRAFLDQRLLEQTGVADPAGFRVGQSISLRLHEGAWDLCRDYLVDGAARAAAAAQFAACAALAALVPLWLLVLPPERATLAGAGLALSLAIIGIHRLHWWAEGALAAAPPCDAPASEDGAGHADHGGSGSSGGSVAGWSPANLQNAQQSSSAATGSILALVTLHLLPMQLFLGTGHFCEFAGLQWTAAFVGFESSESALGAVRSGALVAINTFTPHAICAALLLCVVGAELRSCASIVDPSAGDGHSLQRPQRLQFEQLNFEWRTLFAPSVRHRMAPPARMQPHSQPRGAALRFLHWASGVQSVHEAAQWLCDELQPTDDFSAADASCSPQQLRAAEWAHALCGGALLVPVAASAVCLFCASLNAFVQRRHLMIWALFAPKWMFEVCVWAATMGAVLPLAWIADRTVRALMPAIAAERTQLANGEQTE